LAAARFNIQQLASHIANKHFAAVFIFQFVQATFSAAITQ
jgi:hypothetical protein